MKQNQHQQRFTMTRVFWYLSAPARLLDYPRRICLLLKGSRFFTTATLLACVSPLTSQRLSMSFWKWDKRRTQIVMSIGQSVPLYEITMQRGTFKDRHF